MTQIHPSAVVDRRAKLADDAEIGPFCTVGPEVELGPGVYYPRFIASDGATVSEVGVLDGFQVE